MASSLAELRGGRGSVGRGVGVSRLKSQARPARQPTRICKRRSRKPEEPDSRPGLLPVVLSAHSAAIYIGSRNSAGFEVSGSWIDGFLGSPPDGFTACFWRRWFIPRYHVTARCLVTLLKDQVIVEK